MDLVDATVVGIAAPSITAALCGGSGTIQWIAAGYTLALAAGLVTGGRLGWSPIRSPAPTAPDGRTGRHAARPGRARPARVPAGAEPRAGVGSVDAGMLAAALPVGSFRGTHGHPKAVTS